MIYIICILALINMILAIWNYTGAVITICWRMSGWYKYGIGIYFWKRDRSSYIPRWENAVEIIGFNFRKEPEDERNS